MDRLQNIAMILNLTERLRESQSWTGETHLQKALFLLKYLAGVPVDYDFVLYKHGPFSFELREDLISMRADGLLELELQPSPYGPKLRVTDDGRKLTEYFPKTLTTYEEATRFVAEKVNGKGVAELERLGTALYLTMRNHDQSCEQKAEKIHDAKPHISKEQALSAAKWVEEALQEAKSLGLSR